MCKAWRATSLSPTTRHFPYTSYNFAPPGSHQNHPIHGSARSAKSRALRATRVAPAVRAAREDPLPDVRAEGVRRARMVRGRRDMPLRRWHCRGRLRHPARLRPGGHEASVLWSWSVRRGCVPVCAGVFRSAMRHRCAPAKGPAACLPSLALARLRRGDRIAVGKATQESGLATQQSGVVWLTTR